ncbi:MAG: diaminopimelate epimerase [Vicinamibacterales bacterium]
MELIKAHAYGNDFLLMSVADASRSPDLPALARQVCDRHRGVGADGLMVVEETAAGARTSLLNADGSHSEISGNGIRCVAAWLAHTRGLEADGHVLVDTDAGQKRVDVIRVDGLTYTCRAAMGQPEGLREEAIEVAGESIRAVVLRVGNPQCVVLGPAAHLTVDRLHSVAARLAVHPFFPDGTNVELATVERPDRIRILIWERGVGPTEASGTGACAAAVASAAFGGAARAADVVAPGGTQRVEWSEEGIQLTGRASIVGRVEMWGAR